MLSKMLSVVETVPAPVITALGASKKIGRDRWLSLRQLVLAPALSKVAVEYSESAELQRLPENERFDALHDYLKRYKSKSAAKKPKADVPVRDWVSTDRALNVVINSKAKKVAIELTNVEAKPFSEWLSSHLGRLYEEYKGSKTDTHGD
jgi:ParB family chromosome partitioning protein